MAGRQAVGTIRRNPIWKVNTRVGCIFVGCGCMSDSCTLRGQTTCSARVGTVSMVEIRWSNKLLSPWQYYPRLIGTTHAVSVTVVGRLAGEGIVILIMKRFYI
jgi:hypothetical protein